MAIHWFGKSGCRNGSMLYKSQRLLPFSTNKRSKHHHYHLKSKYVMKKAFLVIGLLLLLANIAVGLIVSSYSLFNMCASSLVIVATTLLVAFMAKSGIKDAFKIALTLLFTLLGIVQFVLALLSPEQFKDNWYLIAIIVLVIIESVFVILGSLFSKH